MLQFCRYNIVYHHPNPSLVANKLDLPIFHDIVTTHQKHRSESNNRIARRFVKSLAIDSGGTSWNPTIVDFGLVSLVRRLGQFDWLKHHFRVQMVLSTRVTKEVSM